MKGEKRNNKENNINKRKNNKNKLRNSVMIDFHHLRL